MDSIFDKLAKEELDYIKQNSQYVEIPENTILFYQDDICDNILFLEEGEVQVSMSANLHEEIPLYTLQQGQQCIINTSSALSSTKAIGTAQTKSAIKGYLTPKSVIQELITSSPTYQQIIFSLFSLRFNALTTLVEDIKFKRLDSRILDFLQQHNNSMITITHEALANELGTSRVVVSRVLKDLENKSFIKLHRGKIEVL